MHRTFILDLDGTLMPSHAVDNVCYWAAVFAEFGREGAAEDLSAFDNVTDDGLLAEWCRAQVGRMPSTGERRRIQADFLARLGAAERDEPGAFTPTPGLERWLANRPGGTVAIATGGWAMTARWKLRRAGLDRFALPLAASDHGRDRPAIMRDARARLPNPGHSRPPCYVGDGPWDLAAARALDWDFIGVARGERARRLREAGAACVVDDFRSLND